MNLKTLKDTPPWSWPKGTGKMLLFTVINDELVDALLAILRGGDKSEKCAAGRRSPWDRSSSM